MVARRRVEVDPRPAGLVVAVGGEDVLEVAHAHVVRDDREVLAPGAPAPASGSAPRPPGPCPGRSVVDLAPLAQQPCGRPAPLHPPREPLAGGHVDLHAEQARGGAGQDLVSPTAPSRSSLARAAGLPALSRNTIASSRSGSSRCRPPPRSADASARPAAPSPLRRPGSWRRARGCGRPWRGRRTRPRGRFRRRTGPAGPGRGDGTEVGGSSSPVKARPARVAAATATKTSTNRRARRNTRGRVSAVRTIAAVSNVTIGLFAINSHACAEPRRGANGDAGPSRSATTRSGRASVLGPEPARGVADGADEPILDPLIALAHLAGHTERILLGTGLIVLPQRNPLVLAKQAASLDVLSGGRLILGIEVGYLEPEMTAIGVPMRARGRAPTSTSPRCAASGRTMRPATTASTWTSRRGRPSTPRAAPAADRGRRAHRGGLPARGPLRRRLVRVPRGLRAMAQHRVAAAGRPRAAAARVGLALAPPRPGHRGRLRRAGRGPADRDPTAGPVARRGRRVRGGQRARASRRGPPRRTPRPPRRARGEQRLGRRARRVRRARGGEDRAADGPSAIVRRATPARCSRSARSGSIATPSPRAATATHTVGSLVRWRTSGSKPPSSPAGTPGHLVPAHARGSGRPGRFGELAERHGGGVLAHQGWRLGRTR